MPKRFEGRVAVITGAASGIGAATVAKLASEGAILSLSDIAKEALNQTADEVRMKYSVDQLHVEKCDVASWSDCEKFISHTVMNFGRIDFVFNCAGINPTAYPLTETPDDYFDKLVGVNLKGTYNLTRLAIPHMKSGSSFVNVSSIMGVKASAFNAIYCATKFGVVGFSKAMALELGPKGIRVNVVAPGYINTPTNMSVLEGEQAMKDAAAKVAMGKMGTPEEVADVVAFLFSDESRYMNGSVVEINGGLS